MPVTFNLSCLPCCSPGGDDFDCDTTSTLYAEWSINDPGAGVVDSQTDVPLTQTTIGNYVNASPPGPALIATCVIGPCGGPQQASVTFPGPLFYAVLFPDPPNATEGVPYDSGEMILYRGGTPYGTMRVRS